MGWLAGMFAVGMTYAIGSEYMPAFADSARPTVAVLVVAMTIMGVRSTYARGE